MTDKAKGPKLPEFVLDGTYEDTEWRNAVAKKAEQRNKREAQLAREAPARHPYGANAYRDVDVQGTARWFPDKESADKYAEQHGLRRKQVAPSEGPAEDVKAQEVGLEQERQTRKAERNKG